MEVTGCITHDAEVRKTKNGKDVVSFSIAVNDSFKPKNGEVQEHTEYFNVSYWLSTTIADKLQKGTIVTVTGRVYLNEYKSKDGEHRASIAVHANNIKIVAWPKKKNSVQPAANIAQPEAAGVTADDLPF